MQISATSYHFRINDNGIKSPEDCNLLQTDINSLQGWFTANYMILNISKTEVLFFSRKINIVINSVSPL
jgi:hypothetical protein